MVEEDLIGLVNSQIIEHCKTHPMKDILLTPCYLICDGNGNFKEFDSHGEI